MNNPLLDVRNLSKHFFDGGEEVSVLEQLSFSVNQGETLAIVGASGSGKSTLLHLLSGLDLPSSGEVYFKGEILSAMTAEKRAKFRNQFLGFVYQFHHLLPEFTALENAQLPLLLQGISVQEAESIALDWLKKVGLMHRISHKPFALSGGERQRVAIARAMVTGPLCLMADEPTGNLDTKTAQKVLDILMECCDKKTAILIVTHDEKIAEKMQRKLELRG